jgi:hypothetical protein
MFLSCVHERFLLDDCRGVLRLVDEADRGGWGSLNMLVVEPGRQVEALWIVNAHVEANTWANTVAADRGGNLGSAPWTWDKGKDHLHGSGDLEVEPLKTKWT